MSSKRQNPRDLATVSSSGSLIRRYEEIAYASRCMREAAQASDWERVQEMEDLCRRLIAELKHASATRVLSAGEEKRRFELLRAMLSDDAQIRLRAEPWLRKLEGILDTPPAPAESMGS